MMISAESSEQQGFVMWFRNRFPETLIFAIPNGEYRAKTTAKRLVQEGVVSGVPDLYIPEWRVWVEMKRQHGGRVSKEQERIHRYLKKIGDVVIVGYGAEDASVKILEVIKCK